MALSQEVTECVRLVYYFECGIICLVLVLIQIIQSLISMMYWQEKPGVVKYSWH